MERTTAKEVNDFITVIKQYSGCDFSEYSIKSFTRRLEKLLLDNKTDIAGLIKKIKKNNNFLEETIKNITVNTTELFRDPEIWIKIKNNIIPRYKDNEQINIWHAGASTGQEVFSMLVLINEAGLYKKTNTFATDLNTDVLDTAQSGRYKYREIDQYIKNFNESFEHATDAPQMKKYFNISRKKSLIKVKPILYEKPTYRKHNLISFENPFERNFDIIVCRNVLIYFNHKLQNKIFEFFHENLCKGGTLIIGRHESILGTINSKFHKYKTIYVKK